MIKEFSRLRSQMLGVQEDIEIKKELGSAPAFPASEMKAEVQKARIKRAEADFWEFDKIYFPQSMYEGGYSDPCEMHKKLIELLEINGVHVVFGPRGHGKTVTIKKALLWLLITGKVRVSGVYSEVIDKARTIMADIVELIKSNERLKADFMPNFKQDNLDKVQFRFDNATNKKWRYIQPFSEGRSVRGYGRMFMRPQLIIGDDIETLDSPMNADSVRMRIDKISEAYQSLSEAKRVFVILGNDFSRASALHRLKVEQEQGILPNYYKVYSFPAWVATENRPLWFQRYKSKSEFELRKILQPRNEADWQANFMQNPVPPEGFYFKREYYSTYSELPEDLRTAAYCDPNLSKKGLGDTTAIAILGFSASQGKFYVLSARCKSFSDSNDLLDAFLTEISANKAYTVGMDGNVSQESIWSNNIRNWIKQRDMPFPKIKYCRYKVDDIAKNAQLAWTAGEILFPYGFAENTKRPYYNEECEFLRQLFAFQGKKAGKTDDAPDTIISCYQLMHERRLIKLRGNSGISRSFINEYYFKY